MPPSGNLEQLLVEIEFDSPSIKSRLSGIFHNHDDARKVDFKVPLKIFYFGLRQGIEDSPKRTISVVDNSTHPDVAALAAALCSGMYDMGYELGARLRKYRKDPFLAFRAVEYVVKEVLDYVRGPEAASAFMNAEQRTIWARFNN